MTRQQKTVAKIIELKEFNTEQLEAEVRISRVQLEAEEKNLAGLEYEYKCTREEFSSRQTAGTLPVQEMDLYYTYMKHMSKQVERQKNIVVIRAMDLEERQKALVAAYKEQRLFEILKDRMEGERAKEAVRKDQKESDYQFLTRKDKE